MSKFFQCSFLYGCSYHLIWIYLAEDEAMIDTAKTMINDFHITFKPVTRQVVKRSPCSFGHSCRAH